jgi:hypothetical protein
MKNVYEYHNMAHECRPGGGKPGTCSPFPSILEKLELKKRRRNDKKY